MPRQQTLEEAIFGPSSSSSHGFGVSPRKAQRSRKWSPPASPQRSPRKNTRTQRRKRPATPSSSESSGSESDTSDNVKDIQFESSSGKEVVDVDDDDEIALLPTQKSQGPLKRKLRRAPETPPSSNSESALSEQSEEDLPPVPSTSRKSKRRMLVDSDDGSNQPKRRKLVRGKLKSDTEESEDLMDEVDSDLIIDTRLRGPAKKSKFSTRLEEIKRKRRDGVPPAEDPESGSGDDEADSSDDDKDAPFKSARPDGDALSDVENEENDEDEEFIVHDSDDGAGVELPAQFSRQSHQDDSMHFKVICQLFVHLALQPPEDREEFMRKARQNDYFSVSLSALSRKLGALKDSLVRSSVWKERFTTAINTHPDFELSDLDYAVPHCDACCLGGRKSTLLGRSSGDPYDRNTFEPQPIVIRDSDDGDDDGEQDPPAVEEFQLGRFCAQRAGVYHKFMHWQYLVYQSLKQEVDYLQAPDSAGPGRAFLRITWGSNVERPTDIRDGDQVMRWLDERGIISAEWKKIKKLMERAHQLEDRGGGPDDLDVW
ncbi:hypothetical protein FRB99_000215 [Tulasnella sp. 403]|nr:hypothetical protein FRB99_000215 [Tulasnella sp. 403]